MTDATEKRIESVRLKKDLPEPKNRFKIYAGEHYLTRSGNKVKIETHTRDLAFGYIGDNGHFYDHQGRISKFNISDEDCFIWLHKLSSNKDLLRREGPKSKPGLIAKIATPILIYVGVSLLLRKPKKKK